MERASRVTVGLLSGMHFLVDFLCAFAMYGVFLKGQDAGKAVLFYNFTAFALQMPLGVLLDAYHKRRGGNGSLAFVAAGFLLTLAGSFFSVFIMGIGNALFHVGGGVWTIFEDDENEAGGKALGVFVAPGAVGLFLGAHLAGTDDKTLVYVTAVLAAAVFIDLLVLRHREDAEPCKHENNSSGFAPEEGWPLVLAVSFMVVILRSAAGMSMTFSWKNGFYAGLAAVLCIAAGKAAGGFAFSKGHRALIGVLSLGLAALCFAFPDSMVPGLCGLFFFNMTMPVTLYMLKEKMPDAPGLAFGILTFGLFLGYLPVLTGILPKVNTAVIGPFASMMSLALLLAAWMKEGKRK
ncbi:MAG: hypothetical protein II783_06545 [Erysipelotrichales bacterium]|nr:hypothetical protein [Erysipelotrichales bacterium]